MMRAGQGYDIHRFRQEGPELLKLGGVEISGAKRLDGHSDGDVLIHAVIDALLGAAGEGDIGRHFPPDDPEYKDIDSRELLRRVARLLVSRGFSIGNIDVIVVAEKPRLAEHLHAMRESVALAAGTDLSRVNVKATTNERLGSIGAGEAIASLAVALLEEEER